MDTRRLAPRLLLAALLSVAAGCGGGGGASTGGSTPTFNAPGPSAVSLTTPSPTITVMASTSDSSFTFLLPLTAANAPAGAKIFASGISSTWAIASLEFPSGGATTPQVTLAFKSPSTLGAGTYLDWVKLQACANGPCGGTAASQLNLMVTFVITQPPLVPVNRITLPHDVIDAKYSRALDAVVMVSANPSNALYVYNTKTNVELSQPLSKTPTAVAVGPTGHDAAVGHDGMITYVDLSALTQANPPAPIVLGVSTSVFDLVLDGNGYVHAIPSGTQWMDLHSVNIATGAETIATGDQVQAGSHARLQPGTRFFYTAGPSITGSIESKWDASSGTAAHLYDIFHPSDAACGNFWFADDGITAYTPCGYIYQASPVQAQDMAQIGQIPRGKVNYADTAGNVGFSTTLVTWADESDAARELLAIDAQGTTCDFDLDPTQSQCLTTITAYDSVSMSQNWQRSLPNITVGSQPYLQRALFVFHSSDGATRFAVSTLAGDPTPPAQYYLTAF